MEALLLRIDLMNKWSGDLVFEVVQEQDGGFVAECLSGEVTSYWKPTRLPIRGLQFRFIKVYG